MAVLADIPVLQKVARGKLTLTAISEVVVSLIFAVHIFHMPLLIRQLFGPHHARSNSLARWHNFWYQCNFWYQFANRWPNNG